ncbi:hypothetical protein BT69DRAFT_1221285 [Atractiella rhizophila]|nr:hypothetical protein BT69DRAFT_1221285 [Atractiella rhizophila]
MPHAPSSEFASYRDFGSAPLESRSPVVSPISSPRGRVSIIDEKERASNACQRAGKEEHSRLVVAGTVIFYLVAALIMVFANKWVLTSIPAPLFFLFVQFIIAVSLFHIAAFLGFFSIPTFDVAVARALAPLVSVNVVGLIFNTYCLQYVDASFYQIARGLILPLTSLLSSLILRTTPTALSLIGVVIVCLGFGLGVSSEVLSTSGVGLAFGVFSSFTTSIHAIVVKTSLGKVGNSASEMAYYNNLLSAVLLLPTMLLAGEGPIVFSLLGLSPSSSEYDFEISSSTLHTFVTGSLITGIFGFLICLAGFLSIQVTSPTTHMISSAVRGVLQTFLGAILFGEVVTSGRGMGIGFILAGSAVYVRLSHLIPLLPTSH